MILLLDKPNQLCNKIWSQAPLIAFCLAEGGEMIIPSFGSYSPLFDNLNKKKNIHFSANKDRIYPVLLSGMVKCLKIIPEFLLNRFNVYLDPDRTVKQSYFRSLVRDKKKILLFSGWNRAAFNQQMQKYHHKLREIYLPNSVSKAKVDQEMAFISAKYELIIGVHIRRGDYRKWQNGKYYFDNVVFRQYMEQLGSEIENRGLKCCFLICANEPVYLADLKPFQVFQITKANVIEDLYALSLCDLILGPPSTFSMWASFYGKKPIYFMRERGAKLTLTDFKVIAAQNVFNDGEKVAF